MKGLLLALGALAIGASAAAQDMASMDMSHAMTGALGNYAMSREASGTSWQPDITEHTGLEVMRGPWMVMLHGLLNGVYDLAAEGPRGDTKSFVSGMFMVMAERPAGAGRDPAAARHGEPRIP